MSHPTDKIKPGALLAALFGELATAVADELARRGIGRADGDPWIGHPSWPWSRRRSLGLARSGAFEVRRDGRVWFARRSVIDAYLEAQRVARPVVVERADVANDSPRDGVAGVLAEVGFARRAAGSR